MKSVATCVQQVLESLYITFQRPRFSPDVQGLQLGGVHTFIFDFDSFLWEESLDAMLNRSIQGLPDWSQRKQKIAAIMDAGMENRITMHESLVQRFEVASVTPVILQNYIQESLHNMNPSMAKFLQLLQSHHQKIFVFSGGFKDFIAPFMAVYGISAEHIYGNDLVLQDDGTYTFDPKNLMADSDGKTQLFQQLKTQGLFVGKTLSFGDSSRDVNMGADYGFGYGGLRRRKSVENNSPNYFYKPAQIVRLFQTIFG